MQEGRGSHFDPELLGLFVDLKEKMTEIAFDDSNPIGDDLSQAASIIDDIHLLRPGDKSTHYVSARSSVNIVVDKPRKMEGIK